MLCVQLFGSSEVKFFICLFYNSIQPFGKRLAGFSLGQTDSHKNTSLEKTARRFGR